MSRLTKLERIMAEEIRDIKRYVDDKMKIIDSNVIDYSLWFVYYTEYRNLKELSKTRFSQEIRFMADRFGFALFNAEVSCSINPEFDSLDNYKDKIGKDLHILKRSK